MVRGLSGSVQPEYTLPSVALRSRSWVNGGAKKGYVNASGAITAGQAMQQAKAGLGGRVIRRLAGGR